MFETKYDNDSYTGINSIGSAPAKAGADEDDALMDQLDEGLRQGPPASRDPVPDGKYQVNVERAEVAKSKASGSLMLKWSLRIIGPTHVGRMLFKNSMLATRENASWLGGELKTCGIELKSMRDLRSRLGELLDVKLEVTKKTKGEYDNVYINKRLILDDVPSGERGGAVPSDDLPF